MTRDEQLEKKVLFEAALVRKHLRMLTEHMDHLEVQLANAFADCDDPDYGDEPAGLGSDYGDGE